MAGLQTDDINLPGYAVAERDNDKYFSEKKLSADDVESEIASHELDGIHDGLEFPTEEEKLVLRRVPDTIPWNAYREFPTESQDPSSVALTVCVSLPVIAFVELCERFSYYGTTVVFVSAIRPDPSRTLPLTIPIIRQTSSSSLSPRAPTLVPEVSTANQERSV